MVAKIVKVMLLALIALGLVQVIAGLGSAAIGPMEKAALAACGCLLILAARQVWQIGARRTT